MNDAVDKDFRKVADTIIQRSQQICSSEVSAPYEIPQYPIEEKETKTYFERKLRFVFIRTVLLVFVGNIVNH